MKILMINKFLHPNGGSETYIFNLAKQLTQMGHEVQFFGMEHPGRCVGNRAEAYTADMDFHGGSKLRKLLYPIKTIYSREARQKLRIVLEDFQPDVCHLNNFNYQLTPSIIPEIRAWRKSCRIVYTAHDYQLVCPNHMCRHPGRDENCEKCLGGHYINCLKGRCIHGSAAKSLIGMLEAAFWKWKQVYQQLDKVICCSGFLKTKLDTYPDLADKTVAMHNFIDPVPAADTPAGDYVLYFGRFSREKGVQLLLDTARTLPQIQFIFAGTGPLEAQLSGIPNVKNVGFRSGEELERLIREARFTVYPSMWYENCPFSVMESQMYGTPVVGADIGGIPELIQNGKTGILFPSGDGAALREALLQEWETPSLLRGKALTEALSFDSAEQYCHKLLRLYQS